MRKVVLGLGISLDGYIARPDGAVDFLFMPRDYSMADFFATVDTAIMGRKTLDAGLKMSGGTLPRSNMPMYVFSNSKPPGERDGVIFVNETPASFLSGLRKRPGKDIWLMGGGELARAFFTADLVDRLYLGVVPVLLGEGIPLFPSGFPQRDFTLIENKTFSKGLITLRMNGLVRSGSAGREGPGKFLCSLQIVDGGGWRRWWVSLKSGQTKLPIPPVLQERKHLG